jgi:hypothetical protein
MLDFYNNSSSDNTYFIAEQKPFRFDIYKMYFDEENDIYRLAGNKNIIYRMSGGIKYGELKMKDCKTFEEAKEAAEELYNNLCLDLMRSFNIKMP